MSQPNDFGFATTILQNMWDFADLALNLGWTAQRLDSGIMILDSPNCFISAYDRRKADYCSCFFGIWAQLTSLCAVDEQKYLAALETLSVQKGRTRTVADICKAFGQVR